MRMIDDGLLDCENKKNSPKMQQHKMPKNVCLRIHQTLPHAAAGETGHFFCEGVGGGEQAGVRNLLNCEHGSCVIMCFHTH